VYQRHERRESYVSAGEMGMAECGLYKCSQTAHFTLGLLLEAVRQLVGRNRAAS
jgi:hypothetical protein